MFDNLKKILEKVDADYADIRYEDKADTKVSFNNKKLSHMGANKADGYVLRALKNGGFASISFTKKTDIDKAVQKVMEDAAILSKMGKQPVSLAPVEAIQDTYKPILNEDPRKISLEEKVEVTRHYNNIPLADKKIASTTTDYQEQIREKYFMSTQGAKIQEDLVTTQLKCFIISAEGSEIRKTMLGIGGSDGFVSLRDKETVFEQKTALAGDLLSAPGIKAGVYNVLLDQIMAGVFIHEAFGHFSEADGLEDVPSLREKMKINTKLGSDILSITDDPTPRNQLGHYKYDDEGVLVKPVALMKNGLLTGRLHSRQTAASFGEPVTGHCVAEDYRYAPIVRMGNIFIEPGQDTLDAMIEQIGEGYYFVDSLGGQTSGGNFTFSSQYGYRIRKGKKAELIRDASISGDLYKTLGSIAGIGNDLALCEFGGCGKGQSNPRSSLGAPHIMINNVVVGGV